MGILFNRKNRLDEASKGFKNRIKPSKDKSITGEGFEDVDMSSQSLVDTLSSFNMFDDRYINKSHASKVEKLKFYRRIASTPEVSDVIEDAIIESTFEDQDGKVVHLDIQDENIEKNENKSKTIKEEFNDLFYNKLNIKDELFDYMNTYYIDSELFLERIGKNKKGIVKLKKLPTETMDFKMDRNGRIEFFVQYLKRDGKLPNTLEEAEKDPHIIAFYPQQISYIDYGLYGKNRKDVRGYLEKCSQAYNQLKLLETAVIIYRIVRAPERLVFRIDTGNMPKTAAIKYVEKIKKKMQQKTDYDPNTGEVSNTAAIQSILSNYFLPQCLRLNTYIPLLNGQEKTLMELIEDHNNGVKNEVYSIDQKTGKPIRGIVEGAGITRKNADLVRVWLDNDEYIDCTPDHKFVLRNGEEKEAQYLKEYDSLMPYYTRTKKICKTSNEYTQIYDLKENKYSFVHRLLGPKYKRDYVIHHKDFNRFNNESKNLVSIHRDNHIKLHAKNIYSVLEKRGSNEENRRKQSECMKKYGKENYETFMQNLKSPKTKEHKENLRESILNKFKYDIEYKKKHAKASSQRWENKEFKDHMIQTLSSNIDKEIFNMLLKIIISNNFPSMPKLLNDIIPQNNEFIKHGNHLNKSVNTVKKDKLGKDSFYKILKYNGFNSYSDLKEKSVVNHKVKRVEKLVEKEDTGCLTIKDPDENHNFAVSAGVFVKNSADGRGSQIDTIGGNFQAFSQLDDIHYFQKKLYRSLKYPMSRVVNMHENRDGDIVFAGSRTAEITRDEIKGARFLERQCNRVATDLKEIFLLHLEFKGIKKEYELNRSSFDIRFNPPNWYTEQLQQQLLETRHNNYSSLSREDEFPKTGLLVKYMNMTEDDLKELKDYHEKDKEIFPQDEEGGRRW